MAKPGTRPDVSVVIPCRNEEANAKSIAVAVVAELEPLGHTFEIVFIDNSSTDRTVEIIREMCAQDSRIRLIVNTRNFGQLRSPTHAIFAATGEAVIGMCADFQDPPNLIPQFIAQWKAGADIVLGIREEEKSGMVLGAARRISYALAHKFGDYPIIPNATGFGLYDRRVVDTLKALDEPEPFFRGMLVETGYHIETILYPRPPRHGGKTNNNFFTLLDFAISGLTASSKRLLRVPLYFCVLGLLITAMMLLGAVLAYAFGREISPWLIGAVIQAQFSLLFGFLGLMGEHIRLISDRTRKTPLVIEKERINFSHVTDVR